MSETENIRKMVGDTENIRKLAPTTATADDISNSEILVIDDEPIIREALFEALEVEGYEIKMACDCDEAIEKLKQNRFDLIISDIRLPGMSGDELLQICKREYKTTEVILITGAPTIDAATQAVKDGAYDYLSKPISNEKLYERVKSALIHARTKPNPQIHGDPLPETDYSIVRTLGSGNMGVVLLVQKGTHYYAMKILRRENPGPFTEEKTRRFLREAEILSRINHPNVVKIYEYGISEGEEVPFFVMEFVPGRPLNHFMMNNTLLLDQKISIIYQLAGALDFVHRFGVLHRDIKPGNILITDEMHVKLSDFGIARMADADMAITREILGSPAYMAPESFDSRAPKDQRSDIFSLGVIAYELLTGVKPFHGESIADIMDEIKHQKPIEPLKVDPSLPHYLQDILAKMLAKQPDERFSSAAQVIQAFDHQSGNTPKNQGITTKLLRSLILKDSVWR